MKRMVIVLTIVMVLAGLILASAYALFSPRIEANNQAALRKSLSTLFEGAQGATFQQLDIPNLTIYKSTDAAGSALGYAVQVGGSGYGGTIQMLVGVKPDLKTITGMEVVSNIETPGLGARITEDWFRKQFAGLKPGAEISYVKNQKPDPAKNQIEAISGATISSRAVVTAMNATLSRAVEALGKQGK